MGLNDARVVITVVLFIVFLGIVFWAFSKRQKPRFEEAARSVLEDDEPTDGRREGGK